MRFLLILPLLWAISAYGQNHDYHWSFGEPYYLTDDTTSEFGTCLVDFHSRPPKFTKINLKLRFNTHTTTCSDSSGQLLFYTNGLRIYNHNRQLIENGDTINPGQLWHTRVEDSSGYLGLAPVVIPDPAGKNQYYLIHCALDLNNGIRYSPLYYTHIDMEANNGLGRVTKKNVIMATGNLSEIVGIKHANGRDWWIIIQVADKPQFLRYLVNPDGLIQQTTQTVENLEFDILSGPARARATPDGSKYAFLSGNNFLVLYDFDRCTGLLDKQRVLYFNPNFFYGFIEFSPDSRFLYTYRPGTMVQYDLMADTLDAVHLDTVQRTNFTSYLFPQLRATYNEATRGPDQKLYFTPGPGTRFFSPMHRPNLPGAATDFQEGGIFTPVFVRTTYHHFPNYRLGALIGSSCDTLSPPQKPPGFTDTHYEDFLEMQARSKKQVFRQVPRSDQSGSVPFNPESPQAVLQQQMIEPQERAAASKNKPK